MKALPVAFGGCFSGGITKQSAERSRTNLSVFLTKTLQLSIYCEGDVHLFLSWILGQLRGIVKRFVQCHVFVQSPPGRRPNDKYPVNISHRSDLCTNVSLAVSFYLAATVNHIQPVSSQTYTCCSQYRDAGRTKEIQNLGQH